MSSSGNLPDQPDSADDNLGPEKPHGCIIRQTMSTSLNLSMVYISDHN